MDNRISIRFFRVLPVHESAPPFETALDSAFQSGDAPIHREREIVPGVLVRLERLTTDGSFTDGEIVRRQMTNFPPEANDDGLIPLPLSRGGGLGHCVAFRYSPALQVIAIQFDNRAVSVGRLLEYLRSGDATAEYTGSPLVRADAWLRYGRGAPKKFIIEIANPANLASVEGPVSTATESSKRLAEFFDGPMIRVEVSMGRRNGSLAKTAIDGVINYFTNGAGKEEDIRRLKVNIKPADGSKTESVNFIEEFLSVQETLQLPENSPDRHYSMRQGLIKSCFEGHINYIREVYGATS